MEKEWIQPLINAEVKLFPVIRPNKDFIIFTNTTFPRRGDTG